MWKTELIHDIAELEWQIHSILNKRAMDNWINLDLTIPQMKTLIFIANQGTTNVKKIAEELGVTSANMTGIINRLVKQKLVSRKENPADRRMYELSLTHKGKNAFIGMKERAINSMPMTLSHMNEDDLAALKRALSLWMKTIREVESI